MPNVNVTTRTEQCIAVIGEEGISLMENLREAGIDEVLGLCNGNMACATCHVYVDRAYFDILGPISETESDLLDGSGVRTLTSRLSCQIIVTSAIDGINVTIAPEP